MSAAEYEYAKPGYADYDYVPEVTYVDLDARCARVNFGWNYSGVEGTLDFYQPHHGETLVDADFDNLLRDSRYGLVIHRLAPTGNTCDVTRLGRTLEGGHLGTMITDRKGNGAIRNFRDIDIDEIIGMSVVLQGRYEDFNYRSNTLAQTEQAMLSCLCGPHVLVDTDGVTITIPCSTPDPDNPASCSAEECLAAGYNCPYCSDGAPQCSNPTSATYCPDDFDNV